MTPRALSAVGVLVLGGLVLARLDPKDDPLIPVNVDTLSARDQALVRALRLPDGGLVYAVDGQEKLDGGTNTRVTQPPCGWRPVGMSAGLCRRTGGEDPGVENTMQPGGWLGAGCVRKSCIKYAGEPDDDALLQPTLK